jgi:hypothetical protein
VSDEITPGGEGPSSEDGPPGSRSPEETCSDPEATPTHVLEAATEQPCANHPGRLTMVTCSDCGKPLCPDCMVFSAVGIKCKDCSRVPRSARLILKPERFVLAVAAGLASAIALSFAYYYILGSLRFVFGFVLIFVSAGIGYIVGEAVSRASGRFHGLQTAVTAAVATLIGFLLPPFTAAFLSYGVNWQTVVFALSARGIINWIVMLVAAYLAWNRNR